MMGQRFFLLCGRAATRKGKNIRSEANQKYFKSTDKPDYLHLQSYAFKTVSQQKLISQDLSEIVLKV